MTNLSLFDAVKSSCSAFFSSGTVKKYADFACLAFFLWLFLFALLRLFHQCLKESAGGEKLRKGRFFFLSLLDACAYTAVRLPKFFFALVTLFVLNALFSLGSQVESLFSAQKQVKELSAVVKNLSRMDDIARITVLDDNLRTERGTKAKKYKIEILSLSGAVLSSQSVSMEGEELFIDSVNINFDYAEIGSGRVQNIAFPYRVYTEKIPAQYGVNLTCMYDDENVPLLFLLTDDDVYGIEKPAYLERVREFSALLREENGSEELKKLGVRSFNGSAVHANLSKGDIALVRTLATGGINLEKQAF